jgi:uncharacterized protein (TIGR04255 family)
MILMTRQAAQNFAPEELLEQFPNSPLREVSFEVRFAPRLRISSEIWKLQDALASEYPSVGTETNLTPTGLIQGHFFQTVDSENRVLASQNNFGLIKKRYPGFEAFLHEALAFTNRFCQIYGIDTLTRVGLRYSNQFLLPGGDRVRLSEWVNTFVDLGRVDLSTTAQFVVEMRSGFDDHGVTTRTALLTEPAVAYVLDVDCYVERNCAPTELARLLPTFHESAKRIFLEHMKPALKDEFRRRTQP